MIRSRWFVWQLLAVVLAGAVAPSIRAQGRCPFMANMQMQLQTQLMPPMQMTMPQVPVQQFRQPMMTPPRMPIAAQLMTPFNNPVSFGMPNSTPRLQTPALNMRIPSFNAGLNLQTRNAQLTTVGIPQVHVARIPTLQFTHFSMPALHFNHGAPGYAELGLSGRTVGVPRVDWSMETSMWRRSTLSFAPVTRDFSRNLPRVNIPSLSFGSRPPPSSVNRTVPGANPGPSNPNPIAARSIPKQPTLSFTTPGSSKTTAQLTGNLNFNCGSCHNCKQNQQTGPGLATTQPTFATPQTFRPPVLTTILPQPIAPPPFLGPMYVQVGNRQGTIIQLPNATPPMPTFVGLRPFPSLSLLPAPVIVPQASLMWNATPLTTLPPPSILNPSPGVTQQPQDPIGSPTASMLTDAFSKPPPVLTTSNTAQIVLVETFVPSLPPLPQPTGTTKLELPSIVELMIPAEEVKSTARQPIARAKSPALLLTLLQPPPLPSGGPVTPGELVNPSLDVPPVLPSLVETLVQPPPLPPLPGT